MGHSKNSSKKEVYSNTPAILKEKIPFKKLVMGITVLKKKKKTITENTDTYQRQ